MNKISPLVGAIYVQYIVQREQYICIFFSQNIKGLELWGYLFVTYPFAKIFFKQSTTYLHIERTFIYFKIIRQLLSSAGAFHQYIQFNVTYEQKVLSKVILCWFEAIKILINDLSSFYLKLIAVPHFVFMLSCTVHQKEETII